MKNDLLYNSSYKVKYSYLPGETAATCNCIYSLFLLTLCHLNDILTDLLQESLISLSDTYDILFA